MFLVLKNQINKFFKGQDKKLYKYNLGIQKVDFFFFFFAIELLLNIWMCLFCTKYISYSLPQETTILEPHAYKNTLWAAVMTKWKKVQFWK